MSLQTVFAMHPLDCYACGEAASERREGMPLCVHCAEQMAADERRQEEPQMDDFAVLDGWLGNVLTVFVVLALMLLSACGGAAWLEWARAGGMQ